MISVNKYYLKLRFLFKDVKTLTTCRKNVGSSTRPLEESEIKYRKFMKEALDPLYWLEYLFQGYAGHTDLVIYLEGLPDIKSSRPHFFDNGILPERRRY